jgi:hypothetical protein
MRCNFFCCSTTGACFKKLPASLGVGGGGGWGLNGLLIHSYKIMGTCITWYLRNFDFRNLCAMLFWIRNRIGSKLTANIEKMKKFIFEVLAVLF